MIAETSEPCIIVFTGDSAFLYSVIKWTVNVTRVWVKMLYHCYKFCYSSHKLVASGSQGPGSQVLILDYAHITCKYCRAA